MTPAREKLARLRWIEQRVGSLAADLRDEADAYTADPYGAWWPPNILRDAATRIENILTAAGPEDPLEVAAEELGRAQDRLRAALEDRAAKRAAWEQHPQDMQRAVRRGEG